MQPTINKVLMSFSATCLVIVEEVVTKKEKRGDRRVSCEEFAAKLFLASVPFFLEFTFNYYDKLDGKKHGIMEEISVNVTYTILDPENDGEITREDFESNVEQIENGILSEMKALLQQPSLR